MSSFPKEKRDKLLGLLREELELLGQLREITAEQTALLTEDNVRELNKSLNNRGGLIEKIKGLHQESDILMQSYVSLIKSGSGARIEDIDALADKRREILTEVAETGAKNMALAKERSEQYTQEIKKLDESQKSINAYKLGGLGVSEMFDKTM